MTYIQLITLTEMGIFEQASTIDTAQDKKPRGMAEAFRISQKGSNSCISSNPHSLSLQSDEMQVIRHMNVPVSSQLCEKSRS